MTDAYSFLVSFSHRRASRIEAWSPEAAIAEAEARGIRFQDQRKWGEVFRLAAKNRYIAPSGLFSRATSNGSKRPGWIGI
jgi:hypothetical protein